MGGPTFIVWVVTQQVCVFFFLLFFVFCSEELSTGLHEERLKAALFRQRQGKTNGSSALPSQRSSSLYSAACGGGEETKWWSENPQACDLLSVPCVILDKTASNFLLLYQQHMWKEFPCRCRNTQSCYKEARWQCVCMCVCMRGY